MTVRDPNQPPTDHTVAIIGGAVGIIGLLVVLAIGLEAADSPNTMSIVGVLGPAIGLVAITQIIQLNRTNEATRVAREASVTAGDTNQRAQQIQHALNGGFDARVTNIVATVMDERLAVWEATRDERLRGLIAEELERRSVACKRPKAAVTP